ncbi:FkbM family methyltransferase [Desulfatirhabdium butyrativorans]|uniref:FkbM family methyltransferase n=1 Tax=Desulfatirhabdium butyrativorans TaxID=340467 RepID=UPI0004131519|nr:FkbM family methyltransferase [Desulfatirhabdium butyrativorans]
MKLVGGYRSRGKTPHPPPAGFPLISVVTVCRNAASTIEQTLRSVQAQTYPYREHIVIDGQSTDGTIDILRRHDDAIACWISEPDAGIYDAMNKGVALAGGEWIGILNSDDWYPEQTLQHIADAARHHPEADILHGDIFLVDRSGPPYPIFPGSHENLLTKWQIRHPTCFIRKSIYDRYQYDLRYPINADFDFLLRLEAAGYRFVHIDVPLTCFRTGGISNTPRFRAVWDRFRIRRRYRPWVALRLLVMDTWTWLKDWRYSRKTTIHRGAALFEDGKTEMRILFRRLLARLDKQIGFTSRRLSRNAARLEAARGKPFVDTMPGIELPMVIDPSMYFIGAYCRDIFEPEVLAFLRDRLLPGQTAVDVGANVGYISLYMAKRVGPKGRVIAFEPNPYAFGLLERNRRINGFDHLDIHPAGLGASDMDTAFHCGLPGMEVYSSLADIGHPDADVKRFETIDVHLFRADDWMKAAGIDHIHVLKLDVEGAELSVLQGFSDMLEARRIDWILIELSHELSGQFHYRASDILRLLRGYGYRWYSLEWLGRLVPLAGDDIDHARMYAATCNPHTSR